ncbi:hypothetical protein DCAR_0728587 [Daucus carota subsp. sativus]|uniref:Uncharacterized protein n=1 Tax=Daucus carota subsp. sativus TaxID=79200 RepID=A0A164TP21_DAUCS|nr:PREDICTED: protein RALF-like 4 [Daucus carota subsp. sativus]WOH09132.1 hypothetical protein DCAR_0728587 [Daucus carota subsp. sativus]
MGSRHAAIMTTFILVALASAILADSSFIKFHENAELGMNLRTGTDELEELLSSRRVLAGKARISYDALNKNKVPCNTRGSAYYNCQATGRANPYRRGCTAATRCARH